MHKKKPSPIFEAVDNKLDRKAAADKTKNETTHLNDARRHTIFPQSLSPPSYLNTKNKNDLQDNLKQQQYGDKLTALLCCNRKIHLLHHQCHGSIIPPKEPLQSTHVAKTP